MADFFDDYSNSEIGLEFFLSKCNDYIIEQLELYFPILKDFYLWSAISVYHSQTDTLNTSQIKTSINFYQYRNEIEKLSKWLNEGMKISSFASYTELILKSYPNKLININGRDIIKLIKNTDTIKCIDEKGYIPQYICSKDELCKLIMIDNKIDFDWTKIKPFLWAYKKIAEFGNFEKSFFYILPKTYFREKFNGLFFICVDISKKDYNFTKEMLIITELILQKVFSIDYIKEIKKQESKVLLYATRAAISQLYARTDSHDLGHVFDAYKSPDDFSFNEKCGQYIFIEHQHSDNPALAIPEQGKKSESLFEDEIIVTDKKIIYPHLIGYYNQFIKQRMDFRADVATTDPNSLTTLDFYRDVFLPFNNNLIFCNRISGISDTNFKYHFEIKNNNFKNNEVVFDVAIPNDVLGCQANWIIWSNIIRNLVKHGELDDDTKQNIKFTIELADYQMDEKFCELSIYTNAYEKEEKIKKLVFTRNKAFEESILNIETSNLRDSGLGSIEMATCAAYLRKMPVTEVENEDYDLFNDNGDFIFDNCPVEKENGQKILPIIYAYLHKEQNNSEIKYSLGYKYYLLKPKEILVICDRPETINEIFGEKTEGTCNNISKKDFLTSKGIDFLTFDDLGSKIYDHKILIFVGTSLKSFFNEKIKSEIIELSVLPKRIVFVEGIDDLGHYDSEKKYTLFINKCWDLWLKELNKTTAIKVAIFDNSFKVFEDNIQEKKTLKEVCLYDHNKGFLKDGEGELDIPKLLNGNYHDMLCGHHWIKKYPYNTNWNDNKPWVKQYKESILTNVIVLDERIQKSIVYAGKKYAGKILFALYFEQLGVYIPSPKVENNKTYQYLKTIKTSELQIINENKYLEAPDLNATNLMDQKDLLYKYVSKYINKSQFVVIHLGIIEKLLENKDEKNPKKIEEEIIKIVGSDNLEKVIITSGRGKPNNLLPKYSTIPISLLQNAIETTFDKYRLTQVLYNSRKPL